VTLRDLLRKAPRAPRYLARRLGLVAAAPAPAGAPPAGPFVPPAWLAAKRARIRRIVVCPACLGRLDDRRERLVCAACQTSYPCLGDVPLFLASPRDYVDRTSQTGRTNRYTPRSLEIIRKNGERGGLVLDFGSGFPRDNEFFEHVVLQEILHLPCTDVVSTTPRLPFPDDTFDAIVSESVFEHVLDPFAAARELCRVLAPGGEIHVQTAFLQVYHRDPDHYFNMSLPAIEHLFAGLTRLDSGVDRNQLASYTVRGILGAYRDFVRDRATRAAIDALLALPIEERDRELTPDQHVAVGAGVYFHGRKPGR
jgi:SAM-dependent methyltransferase